MERWLEQFNANPMRSEQMLLEAETADATQLALQLCVFASPTNNNNNNNNRNDLRFLALKFLQSLVSRRWRVRPHHTGGRRPSSVDAAATASSSSPPLPPLDDATKAQILSRLLADVPQEPVAFLATKRAHLVAEIARFESFRWGEVFTALCGEAAPTARDMARTLRQLFCLHVVLKELAGLRLGSHVVDFTLASQSLWGVLVPQLAAAEGNLEQEDEAKWCEARCLVAKCINCLVSGSTELDSNRLAPVFEQSYNLLLLSNGGSAAAATSKLHKQLRKTPLLALRSHSAWFQSQPYFALFVSTTLAVLCATSADQSSSNSSSSTDDNKLFAFQFWTLLVSQQQQQQRRSSTPPPPPQAVLVLDARQVEAAMQSALVHLMLTREQDVEKWRIEGGEHYCLEEEADPVFAADCTKLSADLTLRSAARRFLQCCVDQMMMATTAANATVPAPAYTRLLAGRTPSSPLEWEAWLFALQILPFPCVASLLLQDNVLNKVLACIQPRNNDDDNNKDARCERAILTRRALCVLQDAYPVEAHYGMLGNLLRSAETEDLGVLVQVVELFIAIVLAPVPPAFSLARLAPHLSIPHVAMLWRRLECAESKVRIVDLFAAIVTQQSGGSLGKVDPGTLAFVVDEFVPFALSGQGEGGGGGEVTRNPLICSAVLSLVQACVASMGFSRLQPKSQQVCVNLLRHCVDSPDLLLLDWACVLLVCAETTSEVVVGGGGAWQQLLLPLLSPRVLASVADVSQRCQLIECLAMLLMMSTTTTPQQQQLHGDDYSGVVSALCQHLAAAPSAATVTATAPKTTSKGRLSSSVAFPRAAPDAPFVLYDVCRCLLVLAHAESASSAIGLVASPVWHGVVNANYSAAAAAHDDVREVIELVTLRAQVVVRKLAFFSDLTLAVDFAKQCGKHFDGAGYAPKQAVWRNRLWVLALVFLLTQCHNKQQASSLVPSVVECCAKLQSQGNARPMSSSSSDKHTVTPASSRSWPQDVRLQAVFAHGNEVDFVALFAECWCGLVVRLGGPSEVESLLSPKLKLLLIEAGQ